MAAGARGALTLNMATMDNVVTKRSVKRARGRLQEASSSPLF